MKVKSKKTGCIWSTKPSSINSILSNIASYETWNERVGYIYICYSIPIMKWKFKHQLNEHSPLYLLNPTILRMPADKHIPNSNLYFEIIVFLLFCFFVWWLYCMSFFGFRLLITSLVSPTFSYMIKIHKIMLFVLKPVFHQILLLINFELMCFETFYWHCFNVLCIVK